LFEESNAGLQCSVAKPSSYFLFVAQEKKEKGDDSNATVDFFFLLFCYASLLLSPSIICWKVWEFFCQNFSITIP